MKEVIYRTIARVLPRMEKGFGLPFGHLETALLGLRSRGFDPRWAFDIGANRGKWSSDFKRVFPGCRMTLVEPQREMARYLNEFCAEWKDCEWIESAVSNQVGTKVFTVCPDTYSSGFWQTEHYAKAHQFERREVKTITLDSIVASADGSIPDVVKIDAERHEREILHGANALLGKTELFFIEANLFGEEEVDDFASLIKAMDEHGYLPYDFTWFYQRPKDGALMLVEIAFVLKSSPLRAFKGWS